MSRSRRRRPVFFFSVFTNFLLFISLSRGFSGATRLCSSRSPNAQINVRGTARFKRSCDAQIDVRELDRVVSICDADGTLVCQPYVTMGALTQLLLQRNTKWVLPVVPEMDELTVRFFFFFL
jgi:hypothetical protein